MQRPRQVNFVVGRLEYPRGHRSGEYECSLFSRLRKRLWQLEKGSGNSPGGVLGGLGSPSLRVAGFFAFGGSRFAKLSGSSIVLASNPALERTAPGGRRCLASSKSVPPGSLSQPVRRRGIISLATRAMSSVDG